MDVGKRGEGGGGSGVSGGGLGGAGGGGTGGSGGTGGGNTGGATGLNSPSCLRELFAACGTDGECRFQRADGGPADRFCYASGARAEFTQQATCTSVGRSEVRVTKPDGAPCFTYVVSGVYPGQACENGTLTWTNAAGQVVATGNFSGGSGYRETITCAGGGSWFCVPPSCPSGFPKFGTMTCSEGGCP